MILQLALSSILLLEDTEVGEINADDVTPGVIGFVFTALFALVVILIGVDMYRRIRRVQYRAEVQAEIQEELAAASGSDAFGTPGAGDARVDESGVADATDDQR